MKTIIVNKEDKTFIKVGFEYYKVEDLIKELKTYSKDAYVQLKVKGKDGEWTYLDMQGTEKYTVPAGVPYDVCCIFSDDVYPLAELSNEE